jgi:hypothetical protein
MSIVGFQEEIDPMSLAKLPPPRNYARTLTQLYGDADRMRAFDALTVEERAAAIRRMATEGYSDHGIAAATKCSVEQVRQILAVHGGDDDGR